MLRVRMMAKDFKAITELYKVLDTLYISFKKDGMEICQITPEKVCGVHVELRPEAFVEYVVSEKDYIIGIGDAYLKAMGKIIKRTDVVAGFLEKKNEIVFVVEGGRRKELTFPIRSVEPDKLIDKSNFEKIYNSLKIAVPYGVKELYSEVREIGLLSKDTTISLKAVGKRLVVEAKEEKLWRYSTESIFEHFEVGEEAESNYSLAYVEGMLKVAKAFGEDCVIRFMKNKPMCIEIGLEHGFARFFIAPRL